MLAAKKPTTRRTEGLRVRGRSAQVVDSVLKAAAKELGHVGYAALRIDDVAARCGVNKTTIYRRWPTKSDLVEAMLRSLGPAQSVPDTGTLRGDLLAHFEHTCTMLRSPVGRGVMRTLQAERTDPELERVVRDLRADKRAVLRELFERALDRGELPVGVDTALLAELVAAPIAARVTHGTAEIDMRFVELSVDVVLAGAAATITRPLQLARSR